MLIYREFFRDERKPRWREMVYSNTETQHTHTAENKNKKMPH